MSDQSPALTAKLSPPSESDYDSILAAVMETGRGRWFLAEYARRNRNADTGKLLVAIGRIESMLQAKDRTPAADIGGALPQAAVIPEPDALNDVAVTPRRDPFADIRALSDAGKIALFT